MVKVIIQMEGKTIVEEGEFFFGTVINPITGGYDSKNILCGAVKEFEIPQIMAEAMLAQVKKACGPDTIDYMVALLEFSERITKAVDKELIDNKEQILSDINKAIDDVWK